MDTEERTERGGRQERGDEERAEEGEERAEEGEERELACRRSRMALVIKRRMIASRHSLNIHKT